MGAAAFFLGITEMIGVQYFWKIFYSHGIRIYSDVSPLPRPTDKNIAVKSFKVDEGKFEFISPNECLFISHPHFLQIFRFHTPFPYKGSVIWTEKGASISGRLPIGTTLFFLFWLIGWSIGTFKLNDISFFLTGILFIGVMIAISLPIERKRMIQMIDELKLILNEK